MEVEHPDGGMMETEGRDVDFVETFSEHRWDEKGPKTYELEKAFKHITPNARSQFQFLQKYDK